MPMMGNMFTVSDQERLTNWYNGLTGHQKRLRLTYVNEVYEDTDTDIICAACHLSGMEERHLAFLVVIL